jgi:hypothetical protein
MGDETCPACPRCFSGHVHWLEHSSKDAWVDYCRCNDCGHVWNIAKDVARQSRDVTEPPKSNGESECK